MMSKHFRDVNKEKLGFSCLIFTYPKDNCDDCPYHYHCLKEERKRIIEKDKEIARLKDENEQLRATIKGIQEYIDFYGADINGWDGGYTILQISKKLEVLSNDAD